MKSKWLFVLWLVYFFIPSISFSQNASDYLILQDIGSYKLGRPEKMFPGEPPIGGPRMYSGAGILSATGHIPDHIDTMFEAMYLGETGLPSPTVQVTKHAGSDSDKWLLHEVERGFRDNDTLDATYVSPNPLREINGNRIWFTWGYYRWISNNIVISINFTDYTGTKPEPLEVVQAYLQKFPSTIPTSLVLDRAHSEKWIKDEMERRLWLCDKWYMQFQFGKVEQKEMLKELVKHMNIFLDYREKYYGVGAKSEKKALWEYSRTNNGTAIKNKLAEYKNWWSVNKGGAINLP